MSAYDFQSALDNLAGGAPQTLWAIAFRTLVLTSLMWPSTTAALPCWLLAAVLAEGEPLTSLAGSAIAEAKSFGPIPEVGREHGTT
jgi:hypothetical protein